MDLDGKSGGGGWGWDFSVAFCVDGGGDGTLASSGGKGG